MEEQLKKSVEKLDLSDAEAKRMAECFKDEEFQKMFADYMREMQDPETRKQREIEIQQMEANAGIVTDTPSKGFCFKALVQVEEGKEEQKVFFNVCSSSKCDEATSTRGTGGDNWSIPYSYLPPRPEKDAQGKTCKALDITIGPKTMERAKKQDNFQRLIMQTAVEAYEKKEGVKLQRKFKVMKQMSYKGSGPQKVTLKTDGPSATDDPFASVPKTNTPLASGSADKPASSDTLNALASAIGSAPLSKPNATSPAAATSTTTTTTATTTANPTPAPTRAAPPRGKGLIEDITEKKKLEEALRKERGGPIEPKYKIVERSQFDMGNHLQGGSRKRRNRPSELCITIELPQLENKKELDLEVNERHIHLECGQIYLLDIRLAYQVDEDNGSAKYDKSKRTLTVTLPVIQADEDEEGEEISPATLGTAVAGAPTPTDSPGDVSKSDDAGSKHGEGTRDINPVPLQEEEEEEQEQGGTVPDREREGVREGDEEDGPPPMTAKEQMALAKAKRQQARAEMEELKAQRAAERAGITNKGSDGNDEAGGEREVMDDNDDDDEEVDTEYWSSQAFPCTLKTSTECSAHDTCARSLFSFRQTPTECIVVLRVENINPESLQIGYRRRQLAASYEDKEGKKGHIHFYLHHAINPGKCSHDLTPFNCVITLVKRRATLQWPRLEAAVVPVTLSQLQEAGVVKEGGQVTLENDVMFELD